MFIGDGYEPFIMHAVMTDETEDELPFTDAFNCYPNPFNPETNITFELSKAGNVKIDVYNIKGQKIETLVDGSYDAGKHIYIWKADAQPSGLYLLKYSIPDTSILSKALLLK